MNSLSSDTGSSSSPMDEVAAYAALSQIVMRERPLEETLAEVALLARRTLPEAPEASMTLLSPERPYTPASSGEVAVRLDERQYEGGTGPCLDAAVSGGTILVAMEDPDALYPSFRESARREGVTHSLSVSIPAAGRTAGAALNLYSSGRPFTADSARIAGTFAGYAGFALATAGRSGGTAAPAVELQQALTSRVVVSRAQGVLMGQLRCSRDEAFTALVRLAEEQGVKLHEAARTVVDREA
jgi:hypothetical protein